VAYADLDQSGVVVGGRTTPLLWAFGGCRCFGHTRWEVRTSHHGV